MEGVKVQGHHKKKKTSVKTLGKKNLLKHGHELFLLDYALFDSQTDSAATSKNKTR